MRYSFEPIDVHRGDTELSVLADKLGVAPGTVQRWRERGMEEHNADAVATALGLHPWQLWPEMLAVATAPVQRECETCGETFVLTRADRRFCNKACRAKHPDVMAHNAAQTAARRRQRYRDDPEFREADKAKSQAYRAGSGSAQRVRRRRYYLRTGS